jgi:glutathione S-transferase
MIRLALTIGGISFTDNRLDYAKFQDLKASGELPFGSVPVLSVDGTVASQSAAILRYCGKLAGLYPKGNDALALGIDEFCDGIDDALGGVRKSREPKDRAEWAETGAVRYFGALDAIAKKNAESETWVCGPHLSTADLALYGVIGLFKDGFYDGVPADVMDKFPRLMASFNGVHSHAKVVEWNKAHPWKTFA